MTTEKCLLNGIANIQRWHVKNTLRLSSLARRKILVFVAFQRQISAIAVCKHFMPFFAVLFYMQQTFSPNDRVDLSETNVV